MIPQIRLFSGHGKSITRTVKCLVVSAILLLPLSLHAEIVREEVCRNAAAAFVRNSGRHDVSPDLSMSFETLSPTRSSLGSPAFYAYNISSGGFVIVSADDAAGPVLGYSDKGAFSLNGAPGNYLAWLGMWSDIISDCRMKGRTADRNTAASWEDLLAETGAAASSRTPVLLETAEWNQYEPFNNNCPKIGAEHCLTGCTATSVCILMRYFKWPESGTGTLPSYKYTEGGSTMTINSIVLGDKYDWDQMPLSYNSTATTTQKAQVAKLMYHVGVMLQSNFALDGTAASPADIYPGLIEHMHYDKDAVFAKASCYSTDGWTDLLEENIEKYGPIPYAGYSDNGGHAFILDGFDSNHRFHINWGWGGSQNGYFAFPAFQEYTNSHYAVIGLRKDQGGTYRDDIELYDWKHEKCGLKATSAGVEIKDFAKGMSFTVEADAVANYSQYADFNGTLGIAVTGKEDSIRQILAEKTVSIKTGYLSAYSFDVTLTEPVRIGDKMILVYKSAQTENWTPVPYDREDSYIVGEIPMADSRSIEETTTVSYSVDTGTLTITTKDGVGVKLLSSSGEDVSSAISSQDCTHQIKASLLASDTYSIVLVKGWESRTLKITMGLK